MLNWKEVTTKPIEIHHATLSDGRKLQIDIATNYAKNWLADTIVGTVRQLHPHWYQFEVLQKFELPAIWPSILRPGATQEQRDKVKLEDAEKRKNLEERIFTLCVDYCESLFHEESQKQEKLEEIPKSFVNPEFKISTETTTVKICQCGVLRYIGSDPVECSGCKAKWDGAIPGSVAEHAISTIAKNATYCNKPCYAMVFGACSDPRCTNTPGHEGECNCLHSQRQI